MDAASVVRLESLTYRFGRSYDSYLVMDLDRECFWSMDNRAVLGFVMRGSCAVVIGGLIGPDDAREALLTQFMAHCRADGRRKTVCFGLVHERDLPMFDRHGFQSTKVGEDALIDLHNCSWQGKAYEWVRRQTNYCQRQGLACNELETLAMQPDQSHVRMAELMSISEQFLDATPHGRTMRYFVGQFNPDRLFRRRVFVAIAAGGSRRVEGFVVCTPYRNGTAWGIEMYRSRSDAIRGTMPFLMHATMKMLKSEGVDEVSLCLMPAAGCRLRRPTTHDAHRDSWFIHTYIQFTHRYFNFILDTPGIYHFKSRFRPRSESMYCSVWPKASVRPLHAILSAWGTLQFNPWRAFCRLVRRGRTLRQRSTLAES